MKLNHTSSNKLQTKILKSLQSITRKLGKIYCKVVDDPAFKMLFCLGDTATQSGLSLFDWSLSRSAHSSFRSKMCSFL